MSFLACGWVAGTAALEAGLTLAFYTFWNRDGLPWTGLRLATMQLAAVKWALAYLALIDAGAPEVAGGATSHLTLFLFVAILCGTSYVSASRRSHDLTPPFLLLCSLVSVGSFTSQDFGIFLRDVPRHHDKSPNKSWLAKLYIIIL